MTPGPLVVSGTASTLMERYDRDKRVGSRGCVGPPGCRPTVPMLDGDDAERGEAGELARAAVRSLERAGGRPGTWLADPARGRAGPRGPHRAVRGRPPRRVRRRPPGRA